MQECEAMKPLKSIQHFTTGMDKAPILVEDLRSTIEYIKKGMANISFHPHHQSSGNIWTIRGLKKNLVVVLHYKNEFEPYDEDDSDVISNQEPDESFLVDSKSAVLECKAREPLIDGHCLASRTEKTLMLIEDLRKAVDYIKRTVVNISFHPQHQIGNVWAIRGPQKNLVIMLLYQNVSLLANAKVSLDEQGMNENFVTDSQTKAADLRIKYCDVSSISAVATDEVEYILPDVADSPCPLVKDGTPQSNICEKASDDENEPLLNILKSVVENVMDDFRYSQCCESEIKQEIIIPEITIHHGFTCDSNCKAAHDNVDQSTSHCLNKSEGCRSSLTSEQSKTYNDLHAEVSITCINKDIVHAKPLQLLGKNNVVICQYNNANSMDVNQSISDKMEAVKLKNCSVLLEPLDMSVVKKNVDTQEKEKISIGNQLESYEGNSSNISCAHCGKKFKLDDNLVLRQLHAMSKTYLCSVCDKLISCVPGITIRSQESNVYHCTECRATFRDYVCFNIHMHMHLQYSKYKEEEEELKKLKRVQCVEKTFQCKECDKKFSSKFGLVQHSYVHSEEKPYECSVCKKSFRYKGNLVQHQLVHSGQKSYECSQCKKKFAHKSALNRHKLIHSDQKPFECSECKSQFRHKSNLEQHKLIHSGQKPYDCSVCRKKFSDKSTLNKHKLVHSGEKPHKCLQCGKHFTRNSALNQHKLLHTGEKPYECLQCGERFFYKNALNKHKIIVHGEEKL